MLMKIFGSNDQGIEKARATWQLMAVVTMVCALVPTVASGDFIDDYSANSSADYIYIDSYGSGGSFDVSGGTLNITTGTMNTATVMLDDDVETMSVGEQWSIEATGPKQNCFFLVSTYAGQPNAWGSFGFRVRRDVDGLRIQTLASDGVSTMTDYYSDGDADLTFYVARMTETEFLFSKRIGGGAMETLTTIVNDALAGKPELYVGIQVYGGSIVQPFDNLTCTTVPEPGSLLLYMGLLLMGLLLRRVR